MACKHKSKVWENGWCNVAYMYCTLTQESTCKHNKQTNADRIRVMSDEELADWLARTQIDNVAEALKIACIPWEQRPGLRELTAKDNLEWLKQPAK